MSGERSEPSNVCTYQKLTVCSLLHNSPIVSEVALCYEASICVRYHRSQGESFIVTRESSNTLVRKERSDIAVQWLGEPEALIHNLLAAPPDETGLKLALWAEELSLLAGFEDLVALDSLSFSPFSHQIKAAQIAMRRMRGRALLGDEVGLGKTIEAGLIIKEYLMRRMVQRVLVLTPPGLVDQWREELESKFKLSGFVTHQDEAFRDKGTEAWEHFPRVVASIATARLQRHREAIHQLSYDLLVIDEAHHLKNRSSVTWKFINELERRYILLLTATPVQNSLDELYNLITLLKPGLLSTPKEFKKRFVVSGDPRLPKNRGVLRELLADVMIRHTRRAVSDVKLPPRRATTIRLNLSTPEREYYDAISAFVRDQLQEAQENPLLTPFALQTLQREIGSCPQATFSTLEKMKEGKKTTGLKQQIQALIKQGQGIQSWTKGEALLRILQDSQWRDEKILVFTHFRKTLEQLEDMLLEAGLDFVSYHGGLSIQQKQAVIDEFETKTPLLLSTEAAGEGRNLQFARVMINIDLPWNPQRIEQRVGRIHRIGQTRPVEILNLSAEGTVEDYMLDILDRKLNMFELVIGEMDMILGHMKEEQDFEDLIFSTWLQADQSESIKQAFETLGDSLLKAHHAYQETQEYDDALFGDDFSAD